MAQPKKMSGIEKSAILLISLGSEISSSVIKRLPEKIISRVAYEIANTTQVKGELKENILQEFIEMNEASNYIHEGGIDFARSILTKALGANRANEIINTVSEITQQKRPFAVARKADAQQLLNSIINEHPQTIALVICYLQPEKAAQILSGLPDKLQADVAFRISTMNRTSPAIIKQVEGSLEKKLSNVLDDNFATLGGVKTLVDILNSVDRGTEKNIIEELEKEKPELAEQIKESLFVFEDIIQLDSASIQRIIREIDNRDLALALKGASEDVANIIYKNISKRAAETLKEDIEFMGPVRIVEVEQAQQKIVGIIRRLDDAGEIVIARGGKDVMVL